VLEEVKRPTVARTIGQLETLGLIERQRDAGDGRSVSLTATSAGRAVFEAGQRRRIQPLGDALESLTSEDRRKIEAAVDVLEGVLKRETKSRSDRS